MATSAEVTAENSESAGGDKELVMGPGGKMMTKSAAKKEEKRLAKLEKFKAKEAAKQAATATTTDAAAATRKEKKQKETQLVQEEFINTTPPGEKKDMSQPMANAYQPKAVEAAWYDWWEASGFHKPSETVSSKGTYVIPIPPPNVTGSLHLGHALTNSIQDALIRWYTDFGESERCCNIPSEFRHRMRGFTTVYVPGCDHAGIATQAVVEKRLWKETKQTRHDLGREKFLEKVWEWKKTYGDRIYTQLRRLGSSYDWSRVCFTMDPKFEVAVKEAFVRLHDEGIIYRDTRLVNWSCRLNTALSNLEVDMRELEGKTLLSVPGHDPQKKYEFGVLISFAYPLENSAEKIIVATTRLETMLGDTAIAVNPKDPRYTKFIGKNVIHPFNNRLIPIIADEMVDVEFGTGAVKITPAHDPNDYAVGKKHGLEFINIFNDDGSMNANAAPFAGIMRFDARIEVLKALKQKGLYIETVPNKMKLPICSRSGDVIEPMLKPQWYVNCQQMAKDAMEAVKKQDLLIFPKASEKEWFSWLENIQDWCISRQLWWGHTIPAYFVTIEGEDDADKLNEKYWVSGRTVEEAKQKAYQRFSHVSKEKISLLQDPDVLDTWFSAALWPFAIFGWPEKTPDFTNFYPNSLLETGWDILFFWVARMVFFGMKLTGQVPFSKVFCHAMVRDAHGRKMSKSLGNVIDPIDVIQGITLDGLQQLLDAGNLDAKEVEKAKEGQRKDFPRGIPECGTDAMRFALCSYTSTNRDINLDVLRVEGYRKFCNKLWNATRFALMKLGDNFKPKPTMSKVSTVVSIYERWILHRLNQAILDTSASFHDFNFTNATSAIYKFWLNELCDVYIEVIKPVVDAKEDGKAKESARDTLYTTLDFGLRLIHPFMPFVSEELYQRLGRRPGDNTPSIVISAYPEAVPEWNDPDIEATFESVNGVVKAIRSLMSDYGIKSDGTVYVTATSDSLYQLLKAEHQSILTLAYSKNLEVNLLEKGQAAPAGCALFPLGEECNVYLMVRGKVDMDGEISKLEVKLDKSKNAREDLKKKMNVPDYESRVRADVREGNDAKLKTIESEVEEITKAIENFMKLKN